MNQFRSLISQYASNAAVACHYKERSLTVQIVASRLPVDWSQQWSGLCLFAWPPRSPDLTPCDFFLWGYIKDNVYVPPLPTTLDELTERINSVDRDMLQLVWEEFSYRLDVVRAAGGGHIERVRYMCLGCNLVLLT
jgi:hypothetical protein